MGRVRVPAYVIHYDAPEWCEESVRSLVLSTGIDPVVTVVHNGGPIPRLPDGVRLVRASRNLGYTGGANIGLREFMAGNDPFVLIASHDLIVEAGTIAGLVAAAVRNPRAGIVGPRYRDPKHERCRVSLPDGDAEVDAWIGACLLIRRECVEQVGEFDEAFGSYLEDIDYCFRARDLGWTVSIAPVFADTLGTQSDRVPAIATANWALLDLKRADSGLERIRAKVRMLGGYCRSSLGSRAPWRSEAQRVESDVCRHEWTRVLRVRVSR